MSGRPSIRDEPVLMRWMQLELGRMNDGVVSERKTLAQLLREDRPVSVTKAGKEYRFNREVIARLGEHLPAGIHLRLKLPILFFFDSTVNDSLFLADEPAFRALLHLGELSSLREMEGGRLWVGKPIVFAMMQKYPTIIQVMMR
ncbi:MAG: DUF61 family protein [Methanoregulaceae archaeon]|nr:DUF61 family protein [Methanoregulaceae archaeon]